MGKIVLILLLSGMLLLASCVKEEVPFLYTLRVEVTDEAGVAIEGADVTLKCLKDGRSDFPAVYNGTEKYYEFTDLTATGAYQIWVQKKGGVYRDNQSQVTLDENKVMNVRVRLEEF